MTDEQQDGIAAAQRMFDDDLASQRAGMEVVDLATGRATVRMPVADWMVNGHAMAHGGYVFLLADTAFALACNSHGPVTVAQACDIVFVRPGKEGEVLTAAAVERARFGRSGICDVTVTGEDGSLVAEFRGRSRTIGR